MTVSTTALPVQVTQMKSCPVTCTSTGQVRTACVHEVDGVCVVNTLHCICNVDACTYFEHFTCFEFIENTVCMYVKLA